MNLLHIMAGGLGGGGGFFTYEAAQKVNLIDNSNTVSPYYFNSSTGTPTISFAYIDNDTSLLAKKALRGEQINLTSTGAITFINSVARITNLSSISSGGNIRAGALLKKLTPVFGSVVTLSITFYTSTFSYISAVSKSNITLTDNWVQHYVSATKPATAVYAGITLAVSNAVTNNTVGFAAPFIVAGTSVDYEVYVNQSDLDNKKYFYGKNFAILGDSITQSNTVKFPSITAMKRGFKDYRNYGISGATLTNNTTNNIEAQFNTMLLAGYIPDLLIIEAITNDFGSQYAIGDLNSSNKNEVYGAYNNILSLKNTNFPSCKLMLCTPTQRGDMDTPAIKLSSYMQSVIDYCAAKGLQYIDNYNCGIIGSHETNPYEYTTDGLHPNQAGSFLIGEYSAAQILLKRAYL